jgi:hypothetical protein
MSGSGSDSGSGTRAGERGVHWWTRARRFGRENREVLERGWVVVTLAYGLVRIALAGAFLTEYGLSVKAFAVVEITSSLLYGFSGVHLVRAVVASDHRRTSWWTLGALAGFLAPEVYVFSVVRRVPVSVIVVLVAIVVVSSVVAFLAMRTKLAEARERAEGMAAELSASETWMQEQSSSELGTTD